MFLNNYFQYTIKSDKRKQINELKLVIEKCNIKCERKRKPPDALFFYPETEKKAIHGHFIKSVLCGVG